MTGGYIFSLSTLAGGGEEGGEGTPSQVWVGGVPNLRSKWGGTPSQVQGGTWSQVGGTQSQVRGGTPSQVQGVYRVPPRDQVWIRQSSTASTSYAAGGVPLAFTQEDFLV